MQFLIFNLIAQISINVNAIDTSPNTTMSDICSRIPPRCHDTVDVHVSESLS